MVNTLSPDFKAHPSVFAVEDEYKIIIPVKNKLLMWVRIGNEEYFDDCNGIIRSSSSLHQISVPLKALDEAGEYTVCYRKIIGKRLPYGTKTTKIKEYKYSFNSIKNGDEIRIYHVSDSHGRVEAAVESAKYAGDFNLLVMNGDIANHSGSVENIESAYLISSGITGGNKPCVFSRGNHDLRGNCAELLGEYTPTRYGKSYFTFTLGDLWGLVLDCGEDKRDSHHEYGNTVCCESFRKRETEFIESVIKKGEYKNDSIKHKAVICHVPFTFRNLGDCKGEKSPFDIENETYNKWVRIIGENINPELYIFGHLHISRVVYPGDELDSRNQSCPAVIGGMPKTLDKQRDGFSGTMISFGKSGTEVFFCDNEGNVDNKGRIIKE